jgi:hypothetical protein
VVEENLGSAALTPKSAFAHDMTKFHPFSIPKNHGVLKLILKE